MGVVCGNLSAEMADLLQRCSQHQTGHSQGNRVLPFRVHNNPGFHSTLCKPRCMHNSFYCGTTPPIPRQGTTYTPKSASFASPYPSVQSLFTCPVWQLIISHRLSDKTFPILGCSLTLKERPCLYDVKFIMVTSVIIM